MTQHRPLHRELLGPFAALAGVLLVFLAVLAALTAVTGLWPPLMAVESKSMQHDDTASSVGVIDTGDVVLVDRHAAERGIRTYVSSLADGYQMFGEYGDVVVYQAPGEVKPIVHRAICWLSYNSTSRGFDLPELASVDPALWSVPGLVSRWWGLTEWVDLKNVGYANVTVHIDLKSMLSTMDAAAHGGLITMGDNNWNVISGQRMGIIDQGGVLGVDDPIREEWVMGKVTAEIPWIGTIRLWLTGSAPSYMPHNSIIDLFVALACIIILPPLLYDLASSVLCTWRAGRRK